ncbi:MAG: hypothetical protein FWJ64_00620 [Limnochordia bacterium]
MWWKLAAGAAAGLVVGHFVVPGYWLWLVVGVVAGYLAETFNRRRKGRTVAAGH